MNTIAVGNFVGFEVTTIQDVVKAQACGLVITDKDGYEYTYDIEEEDENGEYFDREPTDKEVFDRIVQDIAHGNTLVAGFWLDTDKVQVVPRAAITLQTDFYIGQKVYAMRNNKIIEGKIVHLTLTRSADNNKFFADYKSRDLGEDVFHIVASGINPNFTNYYCFDNRGILEDKLKRALNDNQVLLNVGNQYIAYGFDEIFATKDELVKHLMEG